jgi:hypothetical protein
MQSRSWMAALTLAAGAILAPGAGKQAGAGEAPVVNKVKLEIQIAGLSRNGCEVEIKPGHAGCRFDTITKRVGAANTKGVLSIDPILAQSSNADRDCAFAITIREPGQAPKTFHRGIRLTPKPADGPLPVQTLTCYLSSPSLAAREGAQPPRR